MEITALTELDAVNNIIGTIGESPINSLENLANVDAINALRILREVSRQEQSRGWSFNIIKEHHLTPDYYTNRILWNDHYLSLKGSGGEKLVRDGKYIKNLTNGSIYFTSYVIAEAVLLIPFDELPEAMRNYIIAKSCYLFQSRYFGDDTLIKVTQAQIADAWQQLMEFEVDNKDYNWFDNQHIQELLSR